jgi:eukaryotic-like serine/threonine-protein kinase
MIGTFVGPYEIKRRLGEGGMGVVYLAVHRVLHTPRAVKILLPEWTRHAEIVERFINEARAAAAIRHRNIIGVHDCGQLPTGEWYILLDYLEGGTLTGFIESHGGPVSLHDAVHILCEIANGVQAAHDHEIVHRDLKPDNIFLTRREGDPHFATILDFGVAKLCERMGKPLTSAGAIIGTPAYMAPEQMRGGKVTAAADVFALGVIAYQLVSGGVLPFQTEISTHDYYHLAIVDLYQRIMTGQPIDPRRRNPSLPEEWVKAIFAALDPVVGRRPASPRAFALLLAEATPGDGFAPSGLALVRAYARELLELGTADATVRAASDGKAAETPAQVSRYKLERKLGAGGMAEVYVGTVTGAEGFARPIAIKRVLAGFANDPAFAEMFIAEARLASRLLHPNIVAVMDFDRDEEGRPFLVMEYVEGKDLAALLVTGLIPISTTIFVIAEALRGLGYAHELPHQSGLRGIVHRDVSPQNVLLSWEGAVKVSDFGIAKALTSSPGPHSQSLKGKPGYMSPEQANSEPLDGRSDLFAVGTMLWEMLTGQRLFYGTAKETIAQVIVRQIPAPSKVRDGVPEDLSRVAMKLLARDLAQRYACAEDALDDLLACADAPRNGPGELATLLGARFERALRRKGSRPQGERRAHPRIPSSEPPVRPASAPALGIPIVAPLSPDDPTVTLRTDKGAVPEIIDDRAAPSNRRAHHPPVPVDQSTESNGGRLRRLAAPLVAATALAGAVTVALLVSRGSSTSAAVPAPAIVTAPAPDAGPGAIVDAMPRAIADAMPRVVVDAMPAITTAPPRDAGASAPSLADAAPVADAAMAAPPPGVLELDVVPWANVWIDGKPAGDTPYRGKLSAGRHRVRISNTAGGSKTFTVTISSSKTTVIDETLQGRKTP